MNDSREQSFEKAGGWSIPEGEEYSWDFSFQKAFDLVAQNEPVILFGPPGTGKTWMVLKIKERLEEENLLGRFELVQFHKKFSYEDFIEGYAPNEMGTFDKRDGVFKAFCKESAVSEKQVDLFVIDEINRAELSTTLGEFLYLIEDREERTAKTSHFNDSMKIPTNLSVIGTMNTADRSISIIDYAIRRRFRFVPIFPDYLELKKILNLVGTELLGINYSDYCEAAKKINLRIARNRLMGRHMQLGHMMFFPKMRKGSSPEAALIDQFTNVLIPQVEAYCGFGNEDVLEEIFNPNIAQKYLEQKRISADDIQSLINDIVHEK